MERTGISRASKMYLLNTSHVLFKRMSHFEKSLKNDLHHVFGAISSTKACAPGLSAFSFAIFLSNVAGVVDMAQAHNCCLTV